MHLCLDIKIKYKIELYFLIFRKHQTYFFRLFSVDLLILVALFLSRRHEGHLSGKNRQRHSSCKIIINKFYNLISVRDLLRCLHSETGKIKWTNNNL